MRKIIFLILLSFTVNMTSFVVFADKINDVDINQVTKSVRDSNSQDASLNAATKLTKEKGGQIIDIVRYIASVILIASFLFAIGRFRNAGDPRAKTMLKAEMVLISVALIITFNLWTIIKIITNIKL